MKFDLFDYQRKAAREVAKTLATARRRYRDPVDAELSAFALAAVTGAGKTVIAAAVIEALFNGSVEYDVVADESAVVLWLTDDESLNKQTVGRIVESSEVAPSQLVSIDSPDFPRLMDTRTVYFLNIQKLYDSSTNYIRASNARPWSLWDTVRNTIEDSSRTLYMVLDEAHKGMGNGKKEKSSTVLRLINGEGVRPAVPIVWGISATPERFKKAIEGMRGRITRPDAEVSAADVQSSGLLKDTILLNAPDETGQFDTALLRVAVAKTIEQTKRWADYCAAQNQKPVLPLLVVQVGDKPSAAELKNLVGTVREEWPDITDRNIRHVFGEKLDIAAAGLTIGHVEPETIQDKTEIRVLLAKNAVTTGWDCPRAEVLFSMRGGQDRTYITQFIGRMVRTPLARRIPSDEILNSVLCLLPKFNAKTTDEVAKRLTNRQFDDDGDSGGKGDTGPKVLREPVVVSRNIAPNPIANDDPRRDTYVPANVFETLGNLPSEAKPDPAAKPIANLFAAAVALSGDGFLAGANERAHALLIDVLDSIYNSSEHAPTVATVIAEIEKADIGVVSVDMTTGKQARMTTAARSDARTIDDAFGAGCRAITKEIATRYQRLRAERDKDPVDGTMDLIQAKLEVAALASLPVARSQLDSKAAETVQTWMATYSSGFRVLPEDRQAEYNRIRGRAGVPMRRPTVLPSSKYEPTKDRKGDGPLPTKERHLLADGGGRYPVDLNEWEAIVVNTELEREGAAKVVGWYRNPAQATENAIQVPYKKPNGEWTTAQPDFVFFQQGANGDVLASIVDPHGTQFDDGLERLRGFADFVERYPNGYAGFESLAKNSTGKLVKLDLLSQETRDAIRAAANEVDLFNGSMAVKYA